MGKLHCEPFLPVKSNMARALNVAKNCLIENGHTERHATTLTEGTLRMPDKKSVNKNVGPKSSRN